jgi:hypothetical protein
MFNFKKPYFILTVILFAIEALIAAYMHDRFIRPWFGDYLVVMLIYCFIRSFIAAHVKPVALFVLLIAYGIEIAQYYNLLSFLGLQHSTIANLILGNLFSWTDMLAYSLGVITIILVEKYRRPTLTVI